MRVDTFTKAVLVVIAIFLGIIAFNPISQPALAQASPGKFDNIQFSAYETRYTFFDNKTGTIYKDNADGDMLSKHQILELGQKLKSF